MKKKTAVLSVIIIVLLIVALAYTIHLYVPSGTAPQKETVTIVDNTGVYVEVKVPVERIVSIIATRTRRPM